MELLQLSEVTTSHGGFRVLNGLSLSIVPGEVHAILGEHGAGKSTMARVMCGLAIPDDGKISINGLRYKRLTYLEARKQGIEFVPQEGDILRPLTVYENFAMLFGARIPRPKHLKHVLQCFLRENGFTLPLEKQVREISSQDLVTLSILKHVFQQPRLLILDEILDKLEPLAFQKILEILLQLKSEGMSVVIISHHISDIYNHADIFSIIRQGQVILNRSVSNIDRMSLIKLAYLSTQKQVTENMPNPDFRAMLRTNFHVLLHLPVVLMLVDNDHEILMLSEAARKYFSIAESDYPGIKVERVLNNSSVLKLVTDHCGLDTSNQLYNIPLVRDGEKRLVDIIINPIQMDNYRVGDIVIFNDITDKEFLKHQLVLKDKLSSLGLLSMGVAHEVNNPLDIMLKCVDLLRLGNLDTSQKELVDDIEVEIDTISKIVETLMSTSGSTTQGVEIIDFNEMLRVIVKQASLLASELGIEISLNLTEKSVLIEANPTQIKQVVRDLIRNSIEAIEEKGFIEISTELQRSDADSKLFFTISDNGNGFDGENSEDIFLPFFSTKSSSGKNLGLGLYSSYNVIKQYGGEISMKENPDKGVTFHIKLPVEDA